MADRGAMPSKPNAIQTPKARRIGKNISGVYQKKLASQLLVRIIEQIELATSLARLALNPLPFNERGQARVNRAY